MSRVKEPEAPKLSLEDVSQVEDPMLKMDVNPEETKAPEVAPFDIDSILNSGAFASLIDRAVEERVARHPSEPGTVNQFVDQSQSTPAPVVPDHVYLKHYRCDGSPELEIVELDMSADTPRLTAMDGAPTMKFRRGHFFATTENQVKQIEWMMAGARGVPDAKQKFGGVVGIYEDSGETLFYCPYGCSADVFVSASKAGLDAHLRATHNVER